MTFSERNEKIMEPITKIIEDLKAEHDKYTCSTKLLSDEEWTTYKKAMDEKLSEHKATKYYHLAEELWMFFLDDTEYVQKELRKRQ